jgi:Domain of unknown function (DUF4167)
MRQGQQHRRGRGRQNGNGGSGHHHNQSSQGSQANRKGQNPLTRSFESNGPDVKIRGNPSHVAEKYMTLARDALSSGDPVLAENYLQHAEHYNRIILAWREQQGETGSNNGTARLRAPGDDFGDEDAVDGPLDAGVSQQPMMRPDDQQPQFDGGGSNRFEDRPRQMDDRPRPPRDDQNRQNNRPRNDRVDPRNDRGDRQNAGNGEFRRFQNDRGDRPERQDRPERNDRPEFRPNDRGDRGDFRRDQNRDGNRFDRPDRSPDRGPDRGLDRGFDPQPDIRPTDLPPMEPRIERSVMPPLAAVPVPVADMSDVAPVPRRRERAPVPTHEQPDFLRRPVRRPRREVAETDAAPVVPDDTQD